MKEVEGVQVEAGQFKEFMRHLAAGVTVVTAFTAEGKPVGATVSAFTSVSLDPPLVLVCLTSGSRTMQAIRERGTFAIHLLAADQEGLAYRFASDQAEKFQGSALDEGEADVPLIRGCTNWLKCRLESDLDGGDHRIVVGLVLAASADPEYRPLVHQNRRFWNLV